MKPCVLIVGHRADPHVIAVRQAVLNCGRDCAVLDRYSSEDALTLSPRGNFKLSCSEGDIDADAVSCVWWRLKKLKIWTPSQTEDEIAAEFATMEWNGVIFALQQYLNEIPWVNPSPQDRLTALKPYQLKLALELGFTIPETIFSNSSTEVRSFVREGKKFIYKQISNFMFPPSDYVFTNEISAETLEGKEHNIRAAPGIYQELIEKSAEWRITVIGDQLFSVRIDSQSLPITSLDWRRDQRAEIFRSATLDGDTSRKILRLHKALGLVYGTYDLIECPDSSIVFLECNPDGQWMWLERATGISIAELLGRYLASIRYN